MTRKTLAILCASSALLCLLGIFLLDRPMAEYVHGSGFERAWVFVEGTALLDHLFGVTLRANRSSGGILLGLVLLGMGVAWWLPRHEGRAARALVFTGTVQIATLLGMRELKGVFGRLRPYQVFDNGDWTHLWFAGGDSFPSGHTAFYWGLFLPLAYLFPRYWLPLLLIPLFIAVARIDAGMHFLGDVSASITLAALMTLIAAWLLRRWVTPVMPPV